MRPRNVQDAISGRSFEYEVTKLVRVETTMRIEVVFLQELRPEILHESTDRLPLSGVTALASYVDAHYRLVASPAGVRVYARR